jgi:hypothetical protein
MSDQNERLERTNLAPSLQPLADDLTNAFRLSIEKAVAHLTDPDQFPMPESEQETEHIFLRYLRKRSLEIQNHAIEQFRMSKAGDRERTLPTRERFDLRSRESVYSQLRRASVNKKIDFGSLLSGISGTVQTKSAHVGETRFSGVRLRLRQVRCIAETQPTGGADTIFLGGIAYTTTRSATKVDPFFVGEFDEDDQKVKDFNPPRILAEFVFADDDVFITEHEKLEVPLGWPREYAFAFIMADQDAGAFFEDFEEIYNDAKDKAIDYVEDKVAEVVGGLTQEAIMAFASSGAGIGGAAGTIAPIIGNIIGAVAGWIAGEIVGAIFNEIADSLADDILDPAEAYIAVMTPVHFVQSAAFRQVTISGHGGQYELLIEWEYFGEVANTQDELRVKEVLGPFVTGSFVNTASDFTLLMGEKSLRTGIHKWKGF